MQPLSGVGQTYAAAYGVNSSGQIAGNYNTSTYTNRAFIYTPGSEVLDIGSVGGTSQAAGINDLGQVVGSETTSGNLTTAFIYSNSTGLQSLGVPPGYVSSGADAINNKGQVVGSLSAGGYSSVPFIYSSATGVQVLGSIGFGSWATAVNNSGVVVGNYNVMNPMYYSDQSAFIYTSGGGIQNLNTLYSSLLVSNTGTEAGFTEIVNANGINDEGQIVGEGLYYNGTTSYQAAFLLDTEAVPEPSTWAMLLGGVGLLAFWRVRTHHAGSCRKDIY